jgi:hypothetical protein
MPLRMTFLLLTTSVFGAELIAGEPWREFKSKEGGITIAFPGIPDTKPGIVFFRKGDGKPFWLMASWESPGMKLDDKKTASDFLQGGQHGIMDRAKGKLLKEVISEHQGRPSREFSFHSEKYGFVRTRLLLANDKLYIVSFYGESEEMLSSKAAEQYFRSFVVK